MEIKITIDGKPAHAMMLKHKAKVETNKLLYKIDRLFVEGHWPKQTEQGITTTY